MGSGCCVASGAGGSACGGVGPVGGAAGAGCDSQDERWGGYVGVVRGPEAYCRIEPPQDLPIPFDY